MPSVRRTLLEQLKKFLSRAGYSVEAVSSGQSVHRFPPEADPPLQNDGG